MVATLEIITTKNNGSQNNSGGFGNNQNDKKDPTVADKEIPQTGEK